MTQPDLGRRLITRGVELIGVDIPAEGRQHIQNVGASDATKPGITGFEIDTVTSGLNFIIDGGGSAITTGIKGDIVMPFGGDIIAAFLLADQSGSIKVDIWRRNYWSELFVTADFPPTDADSITGGDEPEIASATSWSSSLTTEKHLQDWTRGIVERDVLRINVDSVTTITRCTLSFTFQHSVEITPIREPFVP